MTLDEMIKLHENELAKLQWKIETTKKIKKALENFKAKGIFIFNTYMVAREIYGPNYLNWGYNESENQDMRNTSAMVGYVLEQMCQYHREYELVDVTNIYHTPTNMYTFKAEDK